MRDWETAQLARPAHLTSHSRIAPEGEPGQPLIVHGRVFRPDGKTPAPGVIVFAYHTDAKGLYHRDGEHGWRLRGWAVTDQEGRFEFATIRPAPYPSGKVPAHIHWAIEGGGVPRQWAEELRFDDDPLPTERDGTAQVVEFNIRSKAQKDF